MSTDERHLIIECGATKPYRLLTMVETVPTVKFAGDMVDGLGLGQIAAAFRPLKATAGPNDVIKLVSAGTDLTLFSTDGLRATLVRIPAAGFGDAEVVLKSPELDLLGRLGLTALGISTDARRLRGTGPGVEVYVGLREERVPDVVTLVASLAHSHQVAVDAATLSLALRRLLVLDLQATNPPVTLSVASGAVTLEVDADNGSGAERIDALSGGTTELEALMNLNYLADAVASLGDAVTLSYEHATAPMVLRTAPADGAEADLDITVLCMPMRG